MTTHTGDPDAIGRGCAMAVLLAILFWTAALACVAGFALGVVWR